MYLAIAFMVDFDSQQALTFSVDVETDDVDEIILALEKHWKAPLTEDNCSEVLVLEGTGVSVEVRYRWTQEDLFGDDE